MISGRSRLSETGSGSSGTIAFAGNHDFVPTCFTDLQPALPLADMFRKSAAQYGRSFGLGENQCVVRWIEIGRSKEEALQRIMDDDLDIWRNSMPPWVAGRWRTTITWARW